jgi:hypothetical protein
VLRTDNAFVTSYIQRQWKLNPRLAEETLREVRPTLVGTGKLSFEEDKEFLDTAYENGQIQQKASAKNLMAYSPLDDLFRDKRAKRSAADSALVFSNFPYPVLPRPCGFFPELGKAVFFEPRQFRQFFPVEFDKVFFITH